MPPFWTLGSEISGNGNPESQQALVASIGDDGLKRVEKGDYEALSEVIPVKSEQMVFTMGYVKHLAEKRDDQELHGIVSDLLIPMVEQRIKENKAEKGKDLGLDLDDDMGL